MPIYEYTCRKCNAHVEALQKVTDKPLVRCRKCGGKLEKQWSQTSFQLKGAGWYVTDYAPKKADEKEKKTEPQTETKADASQTETKAETATGSESKKSKTGSKQPSTPITTKTGGD